MVIPTPLFPARTNARASHSVTDPSWTAAGGRAQTPAPSKPARPPEFRPLSLTAFERRIVYLVGALQFVFILSIMMITPLGPDFAAALNVEASHIGWIAGSFTAASAVSGIVCALFIDRFDRRRALAVTMLGVVLSCVAAVFAVDLATLLAARIVAGIFGGPASALSTSVIADNVAAERRGQAMGMALGSISICSIIGVPLGLQLALWGGWQAPFLALAVMGSVLTAAVLWLLPPQRAHLAGLPAEAEPAGRRLVRIALRPVSLLAFAIGVVANFPTVMLQVNMAVYVVLNLDYPREDLFLIYVISGLLSLFAMRLTGKAVDRFGSTSATTLVSLGTAVFIYLVYLDYERFALPVVFVVPVLMMFTVARLVSQTAAISHAAPPAERASFMALYQSVQQISSAAAALGSSLILGTAADGRLTRVPTLATLSLSMIVFGPILMYLLEQRTRPTRGTT